MKNVQVRETLLRYKALLFLCVFLFSLQSCNDNPVNPDDMPSDLIDSWTFSRTIWSEFTETDTLVFYPYVDQRKNGFHINFNSDKTCSSSYNANCGDKCGSKDDDHFYKGTFTYNQEHKNVEATILLMKRFNSFTIVHASKDSLLLAVKRK